MKVELVKLMVSMQLTVRQMWYLHLVLLVEVVEEVQPQGRTDLHFLESTPIMGSACTEEMDDLIVTLKLLIVSVCAAVEESVQYWN